MAENMAEWGVQITPKYVNVASPLCAVGACMEAE